MKSAKLLLAAALLSLAVPFARVQAGTLSLSQTYFTIGVGQTATVNIGSGGSVANIVYNSNANVASAVVSGSVLTVLGMGNGSSEIRLCTSNNDCGTVYATVGGGSGNYGNLTFSDSSVSLAAGQSRTIYVYSGSSFGNNYYVSNNGSSSVASISVSGNAITVTGNAQGLTAVTVCQSGHSGNCGTFSVNVSGTNSGTITFSQSSVSVNAGSTTSVYIYANHYYVNSGDNFYVSNNSNSSVVSATVSGSRLDIRGLASGSTSVTVCNQNYSGCGTLYVTVTDYTGGLSISPSSLYVNLNQTANATIHSDNSGYYGNYYVSNNSNSSVVSVNVSGNTVYVTGNNTGSTTITVCGNNGNYGCATLYVTVGTGGVGYPTFTTTVVPQPVVNQYYSYQLAAANGSWPYYYSIYSGNLPYGLSLNSSGLISGTPSASGAHSFMVRVADNAGRTATQSFTMTVGNVSGLSTFKNGTLIRENGTIYTVYKNLKSGFANMDAFNGLGYKLANVIDAGSTSLTNSGYVIGTAGTAHPWGTWIKQGNTVYFVNESGLIPVPYYDIFLNNGGEDRMVVPANYLDFIGKQVLPVMSNNDWRLR